MNNEIKEKWVTALRSGNYKQTTGCLRSENNEFCCLGVLCDVIDPMKWMGTSSKFFSYVDFFNLLPKSILADVGLDRNIENRLVKMNDGGKSFSEIADYIEECL